MKKQLTKEEFLAYLDTIPEETFAGLPGAASFVKKEAIKTARESFGTKTADTFKEALNRGFIWSETPQKSDFWCTLYYKIPSGLGIEEKVKTFDTPYISDPEDPRVKGLIGKKVYVSDNSSRVMEKDAGQAWLIGAREGEYPFVVSSSEGSSDGVGFRYIRPIFDTPYISDPDDPRAASLIGKKVIYADYEDRIMDDTRDTAFLTDIRARSETHNGMFFGVSSNTNGSSSTHFRYIREVPETTVEVTMEEVCKQFGKNVKIKKA